MSIEFQMYHSTIVQDSAHHDENSAVVLMALCHINRKLAVACYDELSNTIMASVYDFSTDEIETTIQSLKQSIEPTLFLLHPNIISNSSLMNLVLRSLDGAENHYRYKALKSSSWQEAKTNQVIYHGLAIRKLSFSEVKPVNIYSVLARHIEIDQIPLRQALVALISFMQESTFKLDDGKVTVAAVIPFPNSIYLQMDSNTFKALQIFHEDIHPNLIKGKGRSKEGFSLFGLFDRTLSIVGRLKLREWMSKPFYDKNRIMSRQTGVDFAIKEFHQDFMKIIGAHMRHFHDVPRLLLRIKKVEATFSDWCQLHSSLVSASIILNQMREFVENDDSDEQSAIFLRELLGGTHLTIAHAIAERMSQVIDFAESEITQELYVRDNFDEVLDNKRALFENLQGYLIEAGQNILMSTPILEKVSVEYVPHIGYLAVIEDYYVKLLRSSGFIEDTPMPSRDENYSNDQSPRNEFEQPNKFSFVFSQDEKFFFKHQIVYQLDNHLGDLQSDIKDLQRSIIVKLEEEILDAELLLMQLSSLIGTFDAYLSLATMAIQCDMTRPQIVDEDVIIIKGGRHLLQELSVDNFVPNDTFVTKEKNISVITGPNSSGKSIYLKQIGLITYLAHIGSWVPCEKAIIGLTDRILTRIATEETVSNPHSTFTIDLNQMSKLINFHTPKSLCLVDEFGKGTTPMDGMALLAGTIKHFTKNKAKILFTTHFTELFHEKILDTTVLDCLHCFRMETIKEDREIDDENGPLSLSYTDKFIPLFKLRYGIENDSEGVTCAANMGVSTEIVNRAKYIKHNIQNGLQVAVNSKASNAIFKNTNYKEILKLFLTEDFTSRTEKSYETIEAMKKLLGREFN